MVRRATRSIEFVHADVCGPTRVASLNNNLYFIVIIDDFSRMTWVYFAKEKSDAFLIFKKFKNKAERQSGNTSKILRTDRSGEFVSKEFDRFWEEFGNRRQLTASYTPQQNSVAARKNRSLVKIAKSMLITKGLPRCLWAEAVHTTTYILNQNPTSVVNNHTPFEAWYGWKLKVNHFKVFSCIASVYIPSQKRQKVKDNSVKCIFVGYNIETKGYQFYNPLTKQLIVSRDVV